MFILDPQLEADSFSLVSLPLSDVRLINNRYFPWLILVPRLEGAVEWVDIAPPLQTQLLEEVNSAANVLRRVHNPHKFNIAALGNMVRQLHIHIIARFETDAAWPKPVWGGASGGYEPREKENLVSRLINAFQAAGANITKM